ncbi:MAG: hypothetical protein M3Z66_10240 [Chloroflexota bacterium]|nr:hypothetical protein [Chloroflexota bacterium]
MRLTRLNLSTLRAGGLAPAGAHDDPRERMAATTKGAVLSRRSALGLAGATVAGASPALKALEATLLGSVEMVVASGRVAFLVRGKERWVIDTRRFDGRPRLAVERQEHRIRIELRDALFPGTESPADFICDLKPGITTSRMRLAFKLGGFHVHAPFGRWLTRGDRLRGPMMLDTRACRLDADHWLTLHGMAQAQFSPDWVLQLSGKETGQLSGSGARLSADAVTVALPGPSAPSVMVTAPAKRTLLTLRRGAYAWPLAAFVDERVEPAQAGALTGTLHAEGSAFDTILIETGETPGRRARRALVAEAGFASLFFQPDAQLQGSDGGAFRFPLQQARFARTFDGAGHETALIARFHQAPVWLRAHGCVLEVGHHETASAFELLSRRGKVSLLCSPALLSVAAPLAGAIAEPGRMPAGTRLELVAGTTARKRQPGVANLHVPQGRGGFFELAASSLSVGLLRSEDLLNITVEFQNFTLQTGSGQPAQLVRSDPNSAAYVIAHFPPQHTAEQAYLDGPSPTLDEPGNVQSRLAGESRLAFLVPSGVIIPYTLESILDWTAFSQSVAATAQPPGGATTAFIAQPQPTETDIEAPWRVHLSPDENAGWARSVAEVTVGPTTEPWHTRLAVNQSGAINEQPSSMRAVWSPDYAPVGVAPPPNPFLMSMQPADRNGVVRLTSDFSNPSAYTPTPMAVDHAMLTSLGAWISMHGSWDAPSGYPNILAWSHIMTQGRDQYVKVVRKGALMPFRHPAALFTVTERQFLPDPQNSSQTVAYLMQRQYIVVRQPLVTFNANDYPTNQVWPVSGGNYLGRDVPLKSVRLTTLTTANLAPSSTGQIENYGDLAFWPHDVNTRADFLFHCISTDWLGQRVEFSMPMLFVDSFIAENGPGTLQESFNDVDSDSGTVLQADIIPIYNGDARNTATLNQQRVDLSPLPSTPPASGNPPDPSQHTDSMQFQIAGVPMSVPLPANQPYYFPSMGQALIHIPAVKALIGQDIPQPVTLNDIYKQFGLDDPTTNAGQVFADVVNTIPLTFSQPTPGGATVTPRGRLAGHEHHGAGAHRGGLRRCGIGYSQGQLQASRYLRCSGQWSEVAGRHQPQGYSRLTSDHGGCTEAADHQAPYRD